MDSRNGLGQRWLSWFSRCVRIFKEVTGVGWLTVAHSFRPNSIYTFMASMELGTAWPE